MIVINGKEIETDAEGYLAQLDDWSEDIASHLAQQDNLQLTEDHWKLLNWIRGYYQENGTAPNLRIIFPSAPTIATSSAIIWSRSDSHPPYSGRPLAICLPCPCGGG